MNQHDRNGLPNPVTTTTLWSAAPVPVQKNFQIDTDQLHKYAQWLFHQPTGGVAINAHTGRGLHWGDDQRGLILEVWNQHRPAGKSIIAAVGAPTTANDFGSALSATRDMAQQASDLGADALMIHPPVFLKNDEEVWQKCFVFHREVIESVQIPSVLFYLYEEAGGLSYPNDLLDELLSLPQVLGVKVATLDSVMTFQEIAGVMRLHPDKKLISGEDRFLGYSFMGGAKAALIGMGAAFVEPQAAMIKAYQSGDHEKFLKLSTIVDAFAQTTFRKPLEGYIARMLACLVHEGVIDSQSAHDPFGPGLETGEFERIGTILKVLRRRFEDVMNA